MKKMTKRIAGLLTVAIILLTTNVKGQTTSYGKFGVDVGLEVGAPTYYAHTYLSNIEAGGTARIQMGISSNLAVIVTSGYYNMFSKNVTIDGVTGKSPGLGIIPVKGGLKGFLGGGIYYTGEAGAGFETSRDITTGQKDTKLILAGGLGYSMNSWDVGVRYESFTGQGFDYGLIGLRLAYVIGSTSSKMSR